MQHNFQFISKHSSDVQRAYDNLQDILRQITGECSKKRGETNMTVEEIFEQTSKQEVFDKSIEYWNSGKTKEWLDLKIDLVIGKREGYYFWDMDGKKLMDVHINGGTYSLGHRNPEVISALIEATKYVDIGNHHFPSPLKAKLADPVEARLLTWQSNVPGRQPGERK